MMLDGLNVIFDLNFIYLSIETAPHSFCQRALHLTRWGGERSLDEDWGV